MQLKGKGIRLAVLGACHAGRRDNINAWTGMAPALTYAGIPAVVGMQYTIEDPNAITFSRRFYSTGGRTADRRGSRRRTARDILYKSDDENRDWGVPVLYLRAEEGVLFPRSDPYAGSAARDDGDDITRGSAVLDDGGFIARKPNRQPSARLRIRR